MKKIFAIIAASALAAGLFSCSDDDDSWEDYMEWRDANNAWFNELKNRTNPDGTPYYKIINPAWSPNTSVLIHYFNDRRETLDKLSPIYTSTVDTRYFLHLYDGTPADSSVNSTNAGTKGVYRARLNEMILGWGIALPEMRCGDTAEVIIPYNLAYGTQNLGIIKPFSNLRFNIRLVDIPNYESIPY